MVPFYWSIEQQNALDELKANSDVVVQLHSLTKEATHECDRYFRN